jgi:hypothetical protein
MLIVSRKYSNNIMLNKAIRLRAICGYGAALSEPDGLAD